MLALIFSWAAPDVAAYPLSADQEARLKQYIPRTYAKLAKREPVTIAGLGDNVMMVTTHDEHRNDLLRGYLGRFAHRLEREFFYTGGVKVIEALNGGPAKLHNHLGPEIAIQCLASEGGVAFQAFQRLTTDAFLCEPDLILISYGTNDALADYPIKEFRRALDEAVAMCKERGVDVIVLGSTATIQSSGPTGLGLERPFADAAREVAEVQRVLFVDLGSAMIEGAGAPFNVEPERAITIAAGQVKNHFDHGSEVEDFVNPDAEAHEFLGDRIRDVLFERVPRARYSVSGSSHLESEGRVRVEFKLRNETAEARRGYLCTLDSGRWLTSTNPYLAFELAPGESKPFEVNFQLLRSPVYGDDFAFERWGSTMTSYFPILIADDAQTQITGFSAVQKPLHVIWQTGFQDEVREAFKIGCRVINTKGEAVSGQYTMRWGDQETKGDIALKDGESRELQFTLQLPKPGTTLSLRSSLDAVFRIGGGEYLFRREIEALQNLSLGQRVALSPEDQYRPNAGIAADAAPEGAVFMHAAADEKALYVIFEIPEAIEIREIEGKRSIIAELTIDGRSYGARRNFGFVDKLRVTKNAGDGPGRTEKLPLALFGNGYNKILDPAGITSVLKTGEDGKRRFTIVIPRHYLHLHEWQLGNPNSLLGFNPVIQFLEVSPDNPLGTYPAGRRFVYASSRLSESDPLSLAVLELSGKGTGRWSVRFY